MDGSAGDLWFRQTKRSFLATVQALPTGFA
jgi:hypothetical protein